MVSAVIAEFNPFHNGHAYLLEFAGRDSDSVIAVMSGNFVQRGDIAVYPKHLRALMALKNGADMVISLPAGWSMSGAENFAFGGVSLIKNTKIVDRIVFGAETDSAALLKNTAEIFNSDSINKPIKRYLSSGITFAAARQKAVSEISEECAEILSTPNNILAIEYLSAMNKLHFNAEILPVKRVGAQHDSFSVTGNFSSASNIRKMIINGEDYTFFVPQNIVGLMKENEYSDTSLIDASLMFKLRSLSLDDIKKLPDISEGIENRIFEAIKSAESLDDLCEKIKTKRYTYSRIKRIILSACFGIDASYIKKEPPYIQVLGVNNTGKELLSEIVKKADIPVLVSAKDINALEGYAKTVFETEAVADDLYGLAFRTYKKSGSAYALPLVKID